MIILLDTGVLGLITNPRGGQLATDCAQWFRQRIAEAFEFAIPEIVDYELRRELIRAGLGPAVERLDALKNALRYLPITTESMLLAAEYWARARNLGRPTASDRALDGDMILSAQAALAKAIDPDVVIASDNVGHLTMFSDARPWRSITSNT
jgi:predicted nucleic acid-binding protein